MHDEGNAKTHGLSDSKIYRVYKSMINRCLNPNRKAYDRYGGRGIKVCDRWLNSFENFYEDVSQLEYFGEAGYSLDRIDNDKDYSPDNVKWSTKKEQARNRCTSRIVEYGDEKMTLIEAAEKSGVNYFVLSYRYKHGDRGEKLFRPVEEKYHHKN